MILFCALCIQIQKILMCAQIMGSFSSFFRTLLCAFHNIFIHVACRIIGLVGSIDIR